MSRPLVLLLAVLVLVLGACGDDDDSGDSGSGGDDSAQTEGESGGAESGGAKSGGAKSGGAAGQEAEGESADGGCEKVQQPEPKPDGGARKPTKPLAAGVTYDVTLETSCGEIEIELDQKSSPKTAASFANLAESGFLDGTTFHRIVPGFVIQGGDPTGTGSGGPGYSTRDVPPQDTVYSKGVVAMAKTAAEAPGTAGSQFYIVTAPTRACLPSTRCSARS